MDPKLQEIIRSSTFEIQAGIYIYCKVTQKPSGDHFLISQDKDEITVVTTANKLKDLNLIERNKENYKLIALNVSVPFYSVGFLATVSGAIAKEGMNILIVSTYSKDYILVKEHNLTRAKVALIKLGFKDLIT